MPRGRRVGAMLMGAALRYAAANPAPLTPPTAKVREALAPDGVRKIYVVDMPTQFGQLHFNFNNLRAAQNAAQIYNAAAAKLSSPPNSEFVRQLAHSLVEGRKPSR